LGPPAQSRKPDCNRVFGDHSISPYLFSINLGLYYFKFT